MIKEYKDTLFEMNQRVEYYLKKDIKHFRNNFIKRIQKIFDEVLLKIVEEYKAKIRSVERNLEISMKVFEDEKLRIEKHGLGDKDKFINVLNSSLKAPDYFAKICKDHFKKIAIVHRCQKENKLYNHFTREITEVEKIEKFIPEYDDILKYPNEPTIDKLENLMSKVEVDIKSFFDSRENFTIPERHFPSIPTMRDEEKVIDYKLEVRTKAHKVVMTNLLEVKDTTTYDLSDINELNILLQHHGIKDSDVAFIKRAVDKLSILNSFTLDLRDNKLTSEGFLELAGIFKNMKHILELKFYVGQNDLDDETLVFLTEAMSGNMKYVKKLVFDLKLTNIYSKSAKPIIDMVSSMEHLEEFLVFLNGTKMLKSTKSELKAELKKNKKLKKISVKI